jgi:hypothetical protein
VGACHGAGERGVEVTCDVLTAADGDEVDVLAEASVWEVGAGEGGAADEVESVTEVAAEESQEVGDEVVAMSAWLSPRVGR